MKKQKIKRANQSKQATSRFPIVNMGAADRIARAILGGVFLLWGANCPKGGRWQTLAGTTLLTCSVIGVDPALAAFGASTKMGAGNNVLRLLKATMPGPGMDPKLTDQALPQRRVRSLGVPTFSWIPLKDTLTIG